MEKQKLRKAIDTNKSIGHTKCIIELLNKKSSLDDIDSLTGSDDFVGINILNQSKNFSFHVMRKGHQEDIDCVYDESKQQIKLLIKHFMKGVRGIYRKELEKLEKEFCEL